MSEEISRSDLEAYLDESLNSDVMSQIEDAIRDNPAIIDELSTINGRRDAGVHSMGEIWRRHRLSCPTREQLAGFLLNTLENEVHQYVEFHTAKVGCRYCVANLEDLRTQHEKAGTEVSSRRQKYFESSAGLLRDKK